MKCSFKIALQKFLECFRDENCHAKILFVKYDIVKLTATKNSEQNLG